MLPRVLCPLKSLTWLAGGLSLPPPPYLFRQSSARFSSSDGPSSISPTSCSHAPPVLAASETESILQILRHLAARPGKCVARKSSDINALSDALATLRLEEHTDEFVRNGNLLPLAPKLQVLALEEVTSCDMKALLSSRVVWSISFAKFSAVFNLCKRHFSNGECVGKILARNSGVFLQSIEHLERKFKHLDDFHVGGEARLRMGTGDRGILAIEEDCLQKRLAFLQEIGLSVKGRDKVICRWPRVLLYSVETSMRPTVQYLKSRAVDRTTLPQAIRLHPEYSIENNLAVKFDTLSQAFSDHDVSSIIQNFPAILGMSKDSIKKKIDYLVNIENRDLKEIVSFPACLGYSLEKRIIPRFSILKGMGLLSNYSMSHILTHKRERFMQQFKIPQSVENISQDVDVL